MAQGKLPTIDQTTAILGSIPGMSDVAEIGNLSAHLAKSAGQAAGVLQTPDDGKPKSCWIKSHGRGFGRMPSGILRMHRTCSEGKELSGGLCYDKCP